MVYFATAKNNKIIQGNAEVSDEMRWFTDEELDDSRYGIRDSVRYYAKSALKELGN